MMKHFLKVSCMSLCGLTVFSGLCSNRSKDRALSSSNDGSGGGSARYEFLIKGSQGALGLPSVAPEPHPARPPPKSAQVSFDEFNQEFWG